MKAVATILVLAIGLAGAACDTKEGDDKTNPEDEAGPKGDTAEVVIEDPIIETPVDTLVQDPIDVEEEMEEEVPPSE